MSSLWASPEPLAPPIFNLESLTICRGLLDCRDLKFLIPLTSPPASGLNLATLSFKEVHLYAPEDLAYLFRLASSTLLDLTITRMEGHNNDEEKMPQFLRSLLDRLPATMEKLKSIRVTAKYVTPNIIRNMSRSRWATSSRGDERTYLEISESTISVPTIWKGEPAGSIGQGREREVEDGGNAPGRVRKGQELYEAIKVTEWDEIVFSGAYLAYGRLAAIVEELAGLKGYTITKPRTTIAMTRKRI